MTPDEAYRKNFAAIDWSVPIVTKRPERARGPRGDFAAPMLVRDDIGALRGMHDGKIYDSRSALYRSYKDSGVRILEAGEGPSSYDGERITQAEVGAALDKVRQGYRPAPLETSVLPEGCE